MGIRGAVGLAPLVFLLALTVSPSGARAAGARVNCDQVLPGCGICYPGGYDVNTVGEVRGNRRTSGPAGRAGAFRGGRRRRTMGRARRPGMVLAERAALCPRRRRGRARIEDPRRRRHPVPRRAGDTPAGRRAGSCSAGPPRRPPLERRPTPRSERPWSTLKNPANPPAPSGRACRIPPGRIRTRRVSPGCREG